MTINETKLRIFGPLLLFMVGALSFRLDWYFDLSWKSLIRSDLIAITAGYICWEVSRRVIKALQKRYPGLLSTRRRLQWMLLAMPILVNFAYWLRMWIRMAVGADYDNFLNLPAYAYAVGIQIFYHAIYLVVYEGLYCLQQWKETLLRKEALQRAALQTQLDSLKHQVNPHFLFNSLNALTTLIYEDPAEAEAFVDEISSVYRYLLRTNPNELMPLREELSFLQSYFHLYKTRYGSGVQLTCEVPPPLLEYRLVPCSLQTLVENAIRHNVIAPDRPLQITIRTENDRLVIQNGLQRKRLAVTSDVDVLANLAAQYRRFSPESISIEESNTVFTVSLPLLPETDPIVI